MKEIDIKGVSRENMTTTSVAYFAREKKVYSQKFREIMWHCSDGHRPTKFTIYKEHKYRAHKGVAPAASLCTAGSNDTCYGCKELKKGQMAKNGLFIGSDGGPARVTFASHLPPLTPALP